MKRYPQIQALFLMLFFVLPVEDNQTSQKEKIKSETKDVPTSR